VPRQNMPANWEPPVPAWSADFGGISSVSIAYYGVQRHDGEATGSEAVLALLRSGPDAPDHIERGRFNDLAGLRNEMFVCYWRDPGAYARFAEQSAFARWLSDDARLSGDVGVWVEAFRIPMTRFETLFSTENPAGAGKLAVNRMTGPIAEHGYWGGMRDRIPASDKDDLRSPLGDAPKTTGLTPSRGRRLVLTAPENLCLIRSAQDWSACRGDERASYLSNVHPTLTKGMRFLMENPIETGCLTCRLVEQLTDEGGASDKTFGMAYFIDMSKLEAWSKSHPTHLAIFHSFLSLAQRLGDAITLRLWHEVAALPANETRLEYINCHERTGLLPFLT
jgi:aldoxime dehydratase